MADDGREPEDGHGFFMSRTAGAVARRVAERVKASMPSPFDGLTAIMRRDQPSQGPHVPDRGRRPRAAPGHLGARRGHGDVFDLFFKALTPEQHAPGRHRRRGPLIDPCVGRCVSFNRKWAV
ncbi:MAG: hypothetical protein ACLVI6_08115 [Bifidobacterium bifidum]